MKKVLHGLLVMGAAAVISVGATSYTADAAGITPGNYTVDYANQKITVAAETNTKIYVAKATVTTKKDKNSGEMVMTVKNAAPTEYDLVSKATTIDLSSFAVSKDIYLSIWGNVTTDPTLIKLPAATTKLKAVVDAKNSTVAINNVTDSKNPVEISGTEFCTTNGVWTEYTKAASGKTAATTAATTTVKLTDYAQLGATLRFRVTASASAKLTAAVEIGKDAGGNAVKACVGAGNFASNEVKAKIPKTANGPKATIDYNTRTIKVPNTAEYRVQLPGTALKPFTAATGDAKTIVLSADALITDAAKGAEFDLRTVASDKKPASKITEYKFASIGTITPQTGAGKAFTSTTATTQDVTDTKIKDAEIKVTKLVLSSKTMAGTMTVKNDSAEGYEFIVTDAQDAATIAKLTLPAATDKATGKVAAGRTANIKVKSGQFVFVRKSADVRKMVWATPYVYYGMVSNTLE